MRLVATRRLEIGARLGRDVFTGSADGIPLLRAGVEVTQSYRESLLSAGINAVYVDDEFSAGIIVEPVLREQTRREAVGALGKAFSEAPAAAEEGKPLSAKAMADLTKIAQLIAADVARAGDAALALNDLASADAYTMQHSVDVCAAGLLLARRVYMDHGREDYRGQRTWSRLEDRLIKLGVGLLLHDVGKLVVPAEVLTKPGKLNEQEWALMRTHTTVGAQMLSGGLVGDLSRAVVRSHHERWDGNGYPEGKAGTKIPQVARIASVVDVFDAVTSERAYAPAAPQHVGVQVIRSGSGTAFDPEVVGTFVQVVAPWPPGSDIELADGRNGVVVSVPAGKLHLPRVRLQSESGYEEIELVDNPELAPRPAVDARAA
jgi:HD-GYP domain-containing protein (c-di-GMP phosphodiesterase class II)